MSQCCLEYIAVLTITPVVVVVQVVGGRGVFLSLLTWLLVVTAVVRLRIALSRNRISC